MSNLRRHHDLALKILVGRTLALKCGLPWSLDEDREMIIRERLLWASLTPEEQSQEQKFIADFWKTRGHPRTIVANPAWGSWAEKLGPVSIPDAAFGLPADHFRPWSRGVEVLVNEHPEMEHVLTLLWNAGFQPASLRDGEVTLPIPSHRIVQETERLVGVLARAFPHVRLVAGVDDEGVRLRAVYDAATGQAVIHLNGLAALTQRLSR